MKFPCIFGSGEIFDPPTTTSNFDKKFSKCLHFWFRCDFWTPPSPPPPQTLTKKFLSPNWPNSLKKYFSGFIHFMKISCIFGSGVIFDTPIPHHHLKLWQKISKSQLAKQLKNIFLVDLYISWNFLQFWFKSYFWHPPSPPPPQTLTKNFLSPSQPNSEKIILLDLSISWNFLHFWFRCDFWPPPSLPQTLTKNFLGPYQPNSLNNFLVDLSISWNFLHFWFR